MPEPLKSFFSRAMVRRLAGEVERVHSTFDTDAFVTRATRGLSRLELLDRGRHIAAALADSLPSDYPTALSILVRSLGPELDDNDLSGGGMTPFFYLPHVMFVAERGLNDFEISLDAQYELTKRFTAEFSIRPYVGKDPERTFATLERWARDENAHVRRLVSEGTRLRLPWAPRVPWLDANPERVVALIEPLKDDPSAYVRRSVANSLNDLGKVHPALLFETCEAWLTQEAPHRRALIEHALRSAVKRAEPDALRLLGYGDAVSVSIEDVRIEPARVPIGGRVTVSFALRSTSPERQQLLVDLRVHFVKAAGKTSPKVFKVGRAQLGPGEAANLRKSISLAVHTTRTPRPGVHNVDVVVNGEIKPLGSFSVTPAR